VKTLTFDGAASNMSMVTALGAKLFFPDVKIYILYPITKEKVFIFLDPCHMLKNVEILLVIGKHYMARMARK